MDKIEKFDISETREWNDKEGNHHIEILDSDGVTYTVIPNQSQKQPEGEIPIMKVEDENGSYWVADNHIEEYPTESEKQEEWRKRITWEDGEYFMIDGKDADEEDLREFISQLLSERTRDAKQETIEDFISELECWKVAWIDRTKDKGAEYLRDGLLKMLNKDLSKLLKEEE